MTPSIQSQGQSPVSVGLLDHQAQRGPEWVMLHLNPGRSLGTQERRCGQATSTDLEKFAGSESP